MKNCIFILVLVVFSVLLTSCDWNADPVILGYSEVKQVDDGRFVCSVDDRAVYFVDSLLTIKDGVKSYEKPVIGNEVTVFAFDLTGRVHFYKGNVSADEVKRVYFQGDGGSATINFTLIFFAIIVLYGCASHVYAKSCKQEEAKKQNSD